MSSLYTMEVVSPFRAYFPPKLEDGVGNANPSNNQVSPLISGKTTEDKTTIQSTYIM